MLDRLLYGHSDAAHMLAPLAIATTLGRGRPAQPLAAPFVLGLNGNAITLRSDLAAKVDEPAARSAIRKSIGAWLAVEAREMARRGAGCASAWSTAIRATTTCCATGSPPAASGPTRTSRSSPSRRRSSPMRWPAGEIDGACVGEPWNSVSVERGVGTIMLATAQIWRRGVEKVLAVREPVLEERRPAIEALIRAMRKAGEHFVDPAQLGKPTPRSSPGANISTAMPG